MTCALLKCLYSTLVLTMVVEWRAKSKIVLGSKKCPQQSPQQFGYVWSTLVANKQLHNMPTIAFHCVTTSCPESPDPLSMRLLQKGLGTRLMQYCVCKKAVHVYMCIGCGMAPVPLLHQSGWFASLGDTWRTHETTCSLTKIELHSLLVLRDWFVWCAFWSFML